jgi:hypothetical protein
VPNAQTSRPNGAVQVPRPKLWHTFRRVFAIPAKNSGSIIVLNGDAQLTKTPPKRYPSSARSDVLPEKARTYAKKVAASRELSIKFLKEAGIIEKPGKLARPYR